MVDTIKVISQIDKSIYDKISSKSNIKCMYNKDSGEIFYEIVNDSLKGTYDSSLSVRVGKGEKYGFYNSYCIEVEGSYHKIIKGHNAYDGFYNVQMIVLKLKELVENAYQVALPKLKHWFLQRIDITKSFNLETQKNVTTYINSLNLLSYPRRNTKFYSNECLYVPGQITTLKIYNKLLEFMKNDRQKVTKFVNFDYFEFIEKIKGYTRFEIEIKRKKLSSIYNKKYIRVDSIDYKLLEKIWSDEFMKILKYDEIKLKRVRTKEEVRERLETLFTTTKAGNLYQFFITILNDGYETTKERTSKTSFYRKVSELKEAGIDFSQNNFNDIATIDFEKTINFDPFLWKEVV